MTVMHVPKRPRHPETPANKEEARRDPNQKHQEERLHRTYLSFHHRKRPMKLSFPCVKRNAAPPFVRLGNFRRDYWHALYTRACQPGRASGFGDWASAQSPGSIGLSNLLLPLSATLGGRPSL